MAERVTQWRFIWDGAHGDELGAQWRSEPPTQEEYDEWVEDFGGCEVRVESRMVVYSNPERVPAFERRYRRGKATT